jgi:predicted GH43/DUF377 family glycosyl hydrolase
VGDEYYHFFHAVQMVGGEPVYRLGLYTFSATPPFPIRRVVPGFLLSPDEHDRPLGFHKRVVFPCGALLRDEGRWLVSYGYHDQECRLAIFSAAQIEQRLQLLLVEGAA